jgi:hypothetical protein
MATSSSIEAHSQISNPKRKSKADLIESVVVVAMRSGATDLSMREIQAGLLSRFDMRLDLSSISARVNELVAAGRLLRDKTYTRPCRVTGAGVHPVCAPMEQVRMFV